MHTTERFDYYPQRIVCLTEEPTEILYLLGEEDRIVGISRYTVRPAQVKKEKPKVSAFLDANIEKIIALKPDLVIGFSDIQAQIAQKLIAQGIAVWITNHRSLDEIYNLIVQMGSIVGKSEQAIHLVKQLKFTIDKRSILSNTQKKRPKIYFEEWFEPMISGIRWVSELIEKAGGIDIFEEYRTASLAKDRIINDATLIIERNPDIIIASWCGKKFNKKQLTSRPGWDKIRAIQDECVFEMKSEVILQPGPASLSDGFQELVAIIDYWHKKNST